MLQSRVAFMLFMRGTAALAAEVLPKIVAAAQSSAAFQEQEGLTYHALRLVAQSLRFAPEGARRTGYHSRIYSDTL